jgi:hypothetical protein
MNRALAYAPTNPSSGSGGAGTIGAGSNGGGGFSFAAARAEIDDATTGRITLGVVNLVILGMIAFYIWTRSAQGGA